MPFEVEQVSDAPILIFRFQDPFNGTKDIPAANEVTQQFITETGGPVGRIVDVRTIIPKFAELITAMNASTTFHSGAITDEHVHSAFVGSGELIQLASTAFSTQEQYGAVEIPIFATTEEAIAYLRTKLPQVAE